MCIFLLFWENMTEELLFPGKKMYNLENPTELHDDDCTFTNTLLHLLSVLWYF